MEIQELRERIREWKTSQQSGEPMADVGAIADEGFGGAEGYEAIEGEEMSPAPTTAEIEMPEDVDDVDDADVAEAVIVGESAEPVDEEAALEQQFADSGAPAEPEAEDVAVSVDAEASAPPVEEAGSAPPEVAAASGEPEQEVAVDVDGEAAASGEPEQPQLTAEQIAALEQYGQQLAEQGYSAEQIQAAQQHYAQQMLAQALQSPVPGDEGVE